MLRVTVDVFSGRPNPSWVLVGSEATDILREVSRNRGAITEIDAGYTGLGFRGITLELLSDDGSQVHDLPPAFKVGGGGSQNDAKATELASRLVGSMRMYAATSPFLETLPAFDHGMEDFVLRLIQDQGPPNVTSSRPDETKPAKPPEGEPEAAITCTIEVAPFNPGFWNNSSVVGRNNCYNYASNRRTDTFAQPGRGCGHMYTALTCAEVTRAALCDGCHHRYDCFPDAEKPRWLMALVVAPGYDYHWYRLSKEGFWGHKPGGTPARNTDNSGHLVTNPETCDRRPYTDFCGYFYSCKSQQNRIR